MATSKVDKSKYGPGMGEVVLGAVLSLALGAVLAVGVLVAKPAQVVREVPKDHPFGAVYYVEGSQNSEAGRQWLRKRQLFTEGTTVSLNEDELNVWIAATTGASAAKTAANAKAAAGAPSPPFIELGTPNFRIHDGKLQLGSKCQLNINWFGIRYPVIVQAVGHFVKRGDGFALAMDEFYIGSCPLHRVPVLGELLYQEVVSRIKPPEDIAAAWKKLAGVSIGADTLKLTMP